MRSQRLARFLDRAPVRMEIALSRRQRPVTRDLAQDVHRDPGVGHPGQPGMAKVVADQVLVSELLDDFVPMRRVAENGGADPPALRAGEQPGIGDPAAASDLPPSAVLPR